MSGLRRELLTSLVGWGALTAGLGVLTSTTGIGATAGMLTALVGGRLLAVHVVTDDGVTLRVSFADVALVAGSIVLPWADAMLAAAIAPLVWWLLEGRTLDLTDALLESARTAAFAMLVSLVVADHAALGSSGLVWAATAALLHGAASSLRCGRSWAGPRWAELVGDRRRSAADIGIGAAVATLIGNAAVGVMAATLLPSGPGSLPLVGVCAALLRAAAAQDLQARADTRRAQVRAEALAGLAAATEDQHVAAVLERGLRQLSQVWVGDGPAPSAARRRHAQDEADAHLTQAAQAAFARLAMQREIHDGEEVLRRFTASASDGCYLAGADGMLRFANEALLHLAADHDVDRVPVGRDAVVGLPPSTLLGSGPWLQPGSHRVERAAGRTVWQVEVEPAGDGLVGVVHDVTAQAAAARLSDDIISVVSHELRTPLTPIRANVAMLRARGETMTAERRQRMLGEVDVAATELTELIERLILVAELSEHGPAAGTSGPRIRPGRVVLADVACAAADAAERRHGRSVIVTGSTTATAWSDPWRVTQILQHLLDNACRYAPTGDIVVSVGREQGWSTVRVDDDGPGMTRAEIARALAPFGRTEDPMTMRTGGTGLGLCVADRLARRLDGSLTVVTRPGGGTTVRLRLPATRAPGGRSPDSPVPGSRQNTA